MYRFGPRKISVNPFEDLLCLAWAKLFGKPFNRIAVMFGIVASFNTVTQRGDIPSDSTRIVRTFISDRYPMVTVNLVPQAGRSSADCTATFEVIQRPLPIEFSKSSREIVFAATTQTIAMTSLIRMLLLPLTTSFSEFIRVCLIVFMPIFHLFVRIFLAASAKCFSDFIGIVFAPMSICARYFVRMIALPLKFVSGGLFGMINLPLTRLDTIASQTNRINTALKDFTFDHFFVGLFDTANAANAGIHNVSLSLSRMMSSASSASDRLSVANLADKPIIPYILGGYYV